MVHARHRHRFNGLGQARWAGSIYGGPRVLPALLRPIVYHGPMGLAPFQAVARRRLENALGTFSSLLPLAAPLVLLGALAPLSLWILAAPALALALVVGYAAAIAAAVRPRGNDRPIRLRLLVGALHVVQPFARTWGRLRGQVRTPIPRPKLSWQGDRRDWLTMLTRELASHCRVRVGGQHDRWDLAVSVGPFVSCRVTTAVWQWTPAYGITWRPRAGLFIAIFPPAVLFGLGFSWPALGMTLLSGLVGTCETVIVRRRVRRALSATTETAMPKTGDEPDPETERPHQRVAALSQP
jgi:hypothetical protein